MKNPYTLKLKNGEKYSCGDPFILRFNGRYYLYPSGAKDEDGIRCFISDDLSEFVEYGYVARDERLRNAYAPELICHNGIFYLCTSPGGNGHYFLKSSSPLGPFEFISDNVHSMIDGSFVHDEAYRIRFVRADHNGIVMLNFDEDHLLSDRHNILPQISRGWTEGPTVFYRYPYYYATYCGNFLLSTAYRIKYATSRIIDFDYRVSDEPLLLSTDEEYSALGHNSVVIGPDLRTYYAAYHSMDEHRPFRYLGIDPLSFNGRKLACNVNDFTDRQPDSCTVSCDLSSDRTKAAHQDDFILLNRKTTDRFIAEFNFEGATEIVFSYDGGQYGSIYLSNERKTFFYKGYTCEFNMSPRFDFQSFHSLRLENTEALYVFVDAVPVARFKKAEAGWIGYKKKDAGVYFTAFTDLTDREDEVTIPGTLFPKEGDARNDLDDDGVYYSSLSEGDRMSVKVLSKAADDYYIYLFASLENDAQAVVSSTASERSVTLRKHPSEYRFTNYCLGKMRLNEKDRISIEVLKGTLQWKYILIQSLNTIRKNIERVQTGSSRYRFTPPSRILSVRFTVHQFAEDSLFGLIIHASNYSCHPSNHHPQYMGYLVGFRNDLLVVEHCQYGTERIYDKPVKLALNREYELRVKVDDYRLQVFVDDQFMIQTDLIYQDVIGMTGVLQDRNVSMTNFRQEDFYE